MREFTRKAGEPPQPCWCEMTGLFRGGWRAERAGPKNHRMYRVRSEASAHKATAHPDPRPKISRWRLWQFEGDESWKPAGRILPDKPSSKHFPRRPAARPRREPAPRRMVCAQRSSNAHPPHSIPSSRIPARSRQAPAASPPRSAATTGTQRRRQCLSSIFVADRSWIPAILSPCGCVVHPRQVAVFRNEKNSPATKPVSRAFT